MTATPASGPTAISPPFTEETARAKVKAAEEAWNTRDPEHVALAYTEDSHWRNRDEFFAGRAAIVAFLTRKWANRRGGSPLSDVSGQRGAASAKWH